MTLVIGMNSGSSFDGIDAVLIEITLGDDGQPVRPMYIDGVAYDWPYGQGPVATADGASLPHARRADHRAGRLPSDTCVVVKEPDRLRRTRTTQIAGGSHE